MEPFPYHVLSYGEDRNNQGGNGDSSAQRSANRHQDYNLRPSGGQILPPLAMIRNIPLPPIGTSLQRMQTAQMYHPVQSVPMCVEQPMIPQPQCSMFSSTMSRTHRPVMEIASTSHVVDQGVLHQTQASHPATGTCRQQRFVSQSSIGRDSSFESATSDETPPEETSYPASRSVESVTIKPFTYGQHIIVSSNI